MRNHLGRVFPFYFLENVSIETSNVSYLVLCHFLMSSSLKIQNTLKEYFPLLSLIITNRGETCTLKAIYRHI